MATFKSWTNPKNNEERIYISGLVGQNQSKVFVVKQSADSFGFEYDIKAQIPEGVYSNKNDLINQPVWYNAGCHGRDLLYDWAFDVRKSTWRQQDNFISWRWKYSVEDWRGNVCKC